MGEGGAEGFNLHLRARMYVCNGIEMGWYFFRIFGSG